MADGGGHRLNPLSRSAQQASITIVDELSRALSTMLALARREDHLHIDETYDHHAILQAGLAEMLRAMNGQ